MSGGEIDMTDQGALRRRAEQRYEMIEESIRQACEMAGRARSEVQLIAVSKFHSAEEVAPFLEAGVRCLGENKVQELLPKQEELSAAGFSPEWHFIGTLQRNKVRQIIGKTALIHSVAKESLLSEIEKRAAQNDLVQPVLLQINYSGVPNKQGFDPEDARRLLREFVPTLRHVEVRGVMTMAELDWSDDRLDEFYDAVGRDWIELRELLKDETSANLARFNCLSMGMSNDYQTAIRHGATHIRVGTALFGKRIY